MPITFWTRKFWKIRTFDHNQHNNILIMYTNARFQSNSSQFGGPPILGPNFPKNINEKNFEKINANKHIE